MLNYHRIDPEFLQTKSGTFKHFFSLGSHNSPFKLPLVHSFSVVTMHPRMKFILHENIKGIQHSITIVIPLTQDTLRIDGDITNKVVKNPSQIESECEAKFIFLIVEDEGQFVDEKIIFQGKQLKIQKMYEEGKSIKIKEKQLIYAEEGKLKVKETSEIFNEDLLFYHSGGESELELERALMYRFYL